jgi:hypothetical protein
MQLFNDHVSKLGREEREKKEREREEKRKEERKHRDAFRVRHAAVGSVQQPG